MDIFVLLRIRGKKLEIGGTYKHEIKDGGKVACMQLHDSAFCLPLAAWASPRNLATVLFLMSVVLFFRPVALTPKGDVRTLEEKARGNFFSRRGNEHERLNLSKKGMRGCRKSLPEFLPL